MTERITKKQGVTKTRNLARPLTAAMARAMLAAYVRPSGNLCPIHGVRAGAERAILNGLNRRGLIAEWNGPVPRINDAGRAVMAQFRIIGEHS